MEGDYWFMRKVLMMFVQKIGILTIKIYFIKFNRIFLRNILNSICIFPNYSKENWKTFVALVQRDFIHGVFK